MGIYDGQVDWSDTLYPHEANLFVDSNEMAQDLLKRGRTNVGIFRAAVELLIDGMRDGQLLEYEGQLYWSQGYVRNYFRGENAYYVTGRPSQARGCKPDAVPNKNSRYYDANTEEKIRIGLLRQREFCLWLRRLDFVRNWPFRPNEKALCQHYGIPSPYMDVSADIRVALFFACCVYEGGKWRPLKNEEFAEADSREDVAKLGGDSRYGVLFAASADVIAMNQALNSKMSGQEITKVIPIGYQPLMRCANQKGYLVPANIRYDMYQDPFFLKVKFRLNRELCDWAFYEMDGGETIYGHDPAADVNDVAAAIKNTRCFSKAALESHLLAEPDLTWEELEDYLKFRGYEVKEEVVFCTSERQKEIEEKWQEEMSKISGYTKIVCRPLFPLC